VNGRARPRMSLKCISRRRYLSSKNPCFPSNVVCLSLRLQELTAENAEVSQRALRFRILNLFRSKKLAA
jgi:hypothetical protein